MTDFSITGIWSYVIDKLSKLLSAFSVISLCSLFYLLFFFFFFFFFLFSSAGFSLNKLIILRLSSSKIISALKKKLISILLYNFYEIQSYTK